MTDLRQIRTFELLRQAVRTRPASVASKKIQWWTGDVAATVGKQVEAPARISRRADRWHTPAVGEVLTEVGYARSGDVFIAYTMIGAGPLDLVVADGFLTHLSIMWEEPTYRRWIERLSSFARVIRFDKRGMGMSDRVQVGTLEERMDDVRAVMDAAGSSRAAILGTSDGGPLAMMFAASHPERVQALLLVGSEVKERVDDDWPWGEVNAAQFAGALEDLATGWGTVGLPPERYAPSLTGLEAERM